MYSLTLFCRWTVTKEYIHLLSDYLSMAGKKNKSEKYSELIRNKKDPKTTSELLSAFKYVLAQ